MKIKQASALWAVSHCAVPSCRPPQAPGLGLLSSSVNRFSLRVRGPGMPALPAGPGMPALPAVSHGSRQGAVEDQTWDHALQRAQQRGRLLWVRFSAAYLVSQSRPDTFKVLFKSRTGSWLRVSDWQKSQRSSEDEGQLWESELLVNHWRAGAGLTFLVSATCQVPAFTFCSCVCAQPCLILCDPWTVATRLLSAWDFPGKNTGVGCHFLFQGLIWTQGLHLSLLHLLNW